MKHFFLAWKRAYLLILLVFDLFSSYNTIAQVDSDATVKTKALYFNLKKMQDSDQFLFGQEFFNSFRFSSGSAHGNEEDSDSKAVTGAHPAVLGSDFHYYLEKNDTERGFHTQAVKWAYQQGYVITFDWHLSARGTTSYEYSPSSANLAKNIVNNSNGDRDWYYGELDKIIEIINEDLVVDDDTIPIIFRPLHEMNGSWFWWGSSGTGTTDNYKALYQLTVDYIKERTRSVLFCWSPNISFNSNYYPGDEYVDVVGVDGYELTTTTLREQVGAVVDFAMEHDKIAALTETGYRIDQGSVAGDNARAAYWVDVILPGIRNDPAGKAKKIAWVLTWINSSWSFPYVPHTGSSAGAKQDFIDFKNSEAAVFGDEIPFDMYVIDDTEPVTSVENRAQGFNGLELSPMPAENVVTIRLNDFQAPVRVVIYDTKGMLVDQAVTYEKEISLDITDAMRSGIYLVRASDVQKTVSKKLVVK